MTMFVVFAQLERDKGTRCPSDQSFVVEKMQGAPPPIKNMTKLFPNT